MAWSFVQSGSAASNAVALTGVTAGNLIVFYIKHEGTTASGDITVSDGTTSFTAGTYQVHTDMGGQMFYLLSANSGNKTYTATFGTAKTFYSCCVMEWNPNGTATYDGNQNTANGNSTTPASGNITTTGSTILAVGAHGNYNGATSNTELVGGAAADQVVRQGSNGSSMWAKAGSLSAAGAQCTIGSTNWVCNIMAFEATAGGGRTTKNTRSNPLGIDVGMNWRGLS